jgi:hypothetical protein
MEDVMARVTLLNSKGEPVGSQTALLPLDILPPDQALPLSVAFVPDVPSDVVPQVQVLTAISLAPKDPRYLDAAFQNTLVRVDWSGLSAQVSGQVGLPADSRPASQIWVAAVAYDRWGSVIGVRRWSGGMQPGTLLPFSFTVSSIVGQIERVEFAVEARP